MTQNDINSKFVEFINEVYASENAAVDRINSRIEETPFQNCNKDSDNICKKPLVNKID